MIIEYYKDYEELSKRGAGLLTGEIRKKNDLLFCAATGSSPEGTYRLMAGEGETSPELFRDLRIIKLDEWWGLPPESAGTCENYLQERLIRPLGITGERYISFRSDAADPEKECDRIRATLAARGNIDLALLGIGVNGHLGLNEPGENLEPFCHTVELAFESMHHSMIEHLENKPSRGMTLGLKEILSSRTIVLLVTGKGKKEAVRTLLSGKITTRCPASFLWLHPKVHCLVHSGVTM